MGSYYTRLLLNPSENILFDLIKPFVYPPALHISLCGPTAVDEFHFRHIVHFQLHKLNHSFAQLIIDELRRCKFFHLLRDPKLPEQFFRNLNPRLRLLHRVTKFWVDELRLEQLQFVAKKQN